MGVQLRNAGIGHESGVDGASAADVLVTPRAVSHDQNRGALLMSQLIDIALDGAAEALDPAVRPWILGVAHLVDTSPEQEAFDPATIESVLDLASRTVQFPSGPVGFVAGGYESRPEPDFQLVTLSSAKAPHLELKIGLGIAGFVAVGLTRSDVFDDGVTRPAGALLTDMESVIADTYTLSIASALQLGYVGPIDYGFTVAYDGQGRGLTLYTLDEATGRPVEVVTDGARMAPSVGRITYSPEKTLVEAHMDVYEMARGLLARYDRTPQLIDLPGRSGDGYDGDPLGAKAERGRLRP